MLWEQQSSWRIDPASRLRRAAGRPHRKQDMANSLFESMPFSASRSGPARSWIRAGSALPKLSSLIALWSARSRQRKALDELARFDPHLLDDIGIRPDQAVRETAKWFWQ